MSKPENRKTKLETVAGLAEEYRLNITRDAESWTAFLDTAAKMYKYPFEDQLLIVSVKSIRPFT